jgi:hypothetical protein
VPGTVDSSWCFLLSALVAPTSDDPPRSSMSLTSTASWRMDRIFSLSSSGTCLK